MWEYVGIDNAQLSKSFGFKSSFHNFWTNKLCNVKTKKLFPRWHWILLVRVYFKDIDFNILQLPSPTKICHKENMKYLRLKNWLHILNHPLLFIYIAFWVDNDVTWPNMKFKISVMLKPFPSQCPDLLLVFVSFSEMNPLWFSVAVNFASYFVFDNLTSSLVLFWFASLVSCALISLSCVSSAPCLYGLVFGNKQDRPGSTQAELVLCFASASLVFGLLLAALLSCSCAFGLIPGKTRQLAVKTLGLIREIWTERICT